MNPNTNPINSHPPIHILGLRVHLTSPSNSCSNINLPSLYCSEGSYARSYFQPTTDLQETQEMSRTMCFPVVMVRSSGGPSEMFALMLVLLEGG